MKESRNKRDVYISMVITNIGSTVNLSTGWDRMKNEYYMITLEFTKEHSYGSDYWDNPKYIFNTFHPMLKRYVGRNLTLQDKEEFKDFLRRVSEEEILELIDIIEEAIDLNWDKLDL